MLIDFDATEQIAAGESVVIDFDAGLGGAGDPPVLNPPLVLQPRRGRLVRRRKSGS